MVVRSVLLRQPGCGSIGGYRENRNSAHVYSSRPNLGSSRGSILKGDQRGRMLRGGICQAGTADVSVVYTPSEEPDDDVSVRLYQPVCGYYALGEREKSVFEEFVGSMSKAVMWTAIFGIFKVAYSAYLLYDAGNFVTLPETFYLMESFVVAGALWVGRQSFTKLLDIGPKESAMPTILEGMQRLGIAFLQIGAMSASMTLLQAMQAASRCPSVIPAFSGLLILMTVLRGLGLRILVRKFEPGSGKLAKLISAMQRGKAGKEGYTFFDRLAVRISAGSLMGCTFMAARAETEVDKGEYEFSDLEESIIRMCIDCMRVASLAMAFEAASYVLLGISAIYTNKFKDLFDVVTDLIDSSFMCGITFNASNSFDKIISTDGQDISHLMKGFSSKGGLSKLFKQFSKLMRSLFMAGLVSALFIKGPFGPYTDRAFSFLDLQAKEVLARLVIETSI